MNRVILLITLIFTTNSSGHLTQNTEAASVNTQNDLYNVQGTLINEGTKTVYRGTIYFLFQTSEISTNNKTLSFLNLEENIGKYVGVKYKSEKNSDIVKKFSAKDKITFYINKYTSEERCFRAVKTSTNIGDNLQNVNFYELKYENKKNYIYVKPGENQTYVIKFKDKTEGIIINTSQEQDVLNSKLAAYTYSCRELSNKIIKGEFNLKNLADLKEVVSNYCVK